VSLNQRGWALWFEKSGEHQRRHRIVLFSLSKDRLSIKSQRKAQRRLFMLQDTIRKELGEAAEAILSKYQDQFDVTGDYASQVWEETEEPIDKLAKIIFRCVADGSMYVTPEMFLNKIVKNTDEFEEQWKNPDKSKHCYWVQLQFTGDEYSDTFVLLTHSFSRAILEMVNYCNSAPSPTPRRIMLLWGCTSWMESGKHPKLGDYDIPMVVVDLPTPKEARRKELLIELYKSLLEITPKSNHILLQDGIVSVNFGDHVLHVSGEGFFELEGV
jgi:hypothetical protein